MSCVEKACIWPAEANGYCLHHHRMFQEATERYRGVRERPRPTVSGDAEHVLILRAVFRREDKEPFDRSGLSLLGALEYDQNTDSIKCHECGEFRVMVSGMHLAEHELTAKEYRKKHGLSPKTGLCGLFKVNREKTLKHLASVRRLPALHAGAALRVRHVAADLSVETQNARNRCRLQLLARVRKLGQELGRTPTGLELQDVGVYHQALTGVFGSVADAIRLAGMEPRGQGKAIRYDAAVTQTPTANTEQAVATQ